MGRPVLVKTASRTGASQAARARRHGLQTELMDKPVKYLISDGYMLKATKLGSVYVVYILDFPAQVMLAGDSYGVSNELVNVGNRDELLPPADGAQLPTYSGPLPSDSRLQVAVPLEPEGLEPAPYFLLGPCPPAIQGSSFSLGRKRIPLFIRPRDGYKTIDYFGALPKSAAVAVGSNFAVPRFATASLGGFAKNTYDALNAFWVTEKQLPTDTVFHPRRYVDRSEYVSGGQVIPNAYCYAINAQPTLAIAANAYTKGNVDTFCMAAELVQQTDQVWSYANLPRAYDRGAHRKLGIFVGEFDRTDFDPTDPEILEVELVDTRIIDSDSLPIDEIKPVPATYYGYPNNRQPDIPATGPGPQLNGACEFSFPHVARCTDGFVTFALYRGAYNIRRDGVVADEAMYQDLAGAVGMSHAVVVVDPSGRVSVLKADRLEPAWNSEVQPLPVPTADTEKAVIPWIVGSGSVRKVSSTGRVTTVGYAVVWEEWMVRGANGSSGALPPRGVQDGEPDRFYLGTSTVGGEFVVYEFESGSPTRSVVSGGDACMVHPDMYAGYVFPPARVDNVTGERDRTATAYTPDALFTAAEYMGGGYVVTASVPNVTLRTWWPSVGGVTADFTPYVDEHQVSCTVINLNTMQAEVRGSIYTRNYLSRHCIITVVQEYVPAAGDIPEKPAVLLATGRATLGSLDYLPPQDETFISRDGGWTWEVYLTNVAGAGGSFLVGNQFWSNDPAKRVDAGGNI